MFHLSPILLGPSKRTTYGFRHIHPSKSNLRLEQQNKYRLRTGLGEKLK